MNKPDESENNRPKIQLKSEQELQRAHDIVHFLGTPEAPKIFSGEGLTAVAAVHDALAWVLGFQCGEAFQENIDSIQAELRRHGYQEIDVGKPISHEEAKKRGLA